VTIHQFNELTEDQQAFVLEQYGVCISARDHQTDKLLLYQVEGFYVEVFFDPSSMSIKKFKSFTTTDELEPYLNSISLKGVV
jgi:hypothetical protein